LCRISSYEIGNNCSQKSSSFLSRTAGLFSFPRRNQPHDFYTALFEKIQSRLVRIIPRVHDTPYLCVHNHPCTDRARHYRRIHGSSAGVCPRLNQCVLLGVHCRACLKTGPRGYFEIVPYAAYVLAMGHPARIPIVASTLDLPYIRHDDCADLSSSACAALRDFSGDIHEIFVLRYSPDLLHRALAPPSTDNRRIGFLCYGYGRISRHGFID